MFSAGYSVNKLKTNLRLSINRLKLMEKKKTELAQKARKEIADYLASGKDDRARIRVEHIIREDYLVEAMELVELYCDLLLARFGMIQTMKVLDEGLAEPVSSLIWIAPRMSTDVIELKTVADQLCGKYGKEYAKQARTNEIGTVNERLMHKMSVSAPPKILVERYLIEIAKSHNVQYIPDENILNGEQIEDLLLNLNDETFSPPGKGPGNDGKSAPGGGSMGGGSMGGGSAPGGFGGAPGVGFGGAPAVGFGGALGGGNPPPGQHDPSLAFPPPHAPQNFTPPTAPNMYQPPSLPGKPPVSFKSGPPPPLPSKPPIANNSVQPPSYSINDPVYPPPTQPQAPPKQNFPSIPKAVGPADSIPELPSVPMGSLPSLNNEQGDDLDFDELSKRFEDLKKKK